MIDPLNGMNNTNNDNSESDTSESIGSSYDKANNDYLKSIDATLKSLLSSQGRNVSQSNAQDSFNSRDEFRRRNQERSTNRASNVSFRQAQDDFMAGLREGLMESLLGSDFKERVGESVNAFAEEFGLNLDSIRKDLGKELGKQASNAFKNSSLGQAMSEKAQGLKERAANHLKDKFREGLSNYDARNELSGDRSYASRFDRAVNAARTASGTSQQAAAREAASAGTDVSSTISDIADSGLANASDALSSTITDTVGPTLTEAAGSIASVGGEASSAGALLAGLGPVAVEAGIALGALTLAGIALDVMLDRMQKAIEPTIKGFNALKESAVKAANRNQESRYSNLELEKQRMMKDIETFVTEPFNILKDAAQMVYDAWDQNLRLINQTQGYSKDDLHSLMSAYASRLRSEGLDGAVSSSSITENLAKVLESGLSGYIAEEFSYIATKLNAAIPTQDFFSYSDAYASIAGQLVSQGKSQEEAVAFANKQLEQFASNVLYASRNLSGGFTTGLKNASDLFSESVKIAQSGKSQDINSISGLLTSVSAIVGQIAPDLASSITDVISKAATGGNSSELVALRSLAGVNAGNTEFLNSLISDPKQIFATLFDNLASYQNMSSSAFMEVAEGLSSVFGVSMDSFARIDFSAISDAIRSMDVNNSSLSENMRLLQSGESTITNEMLRMQQVNEYMINEGLAFVLEDAGARAIQQHMWDEQIARELMEATYAVELKGSALEFLEGIRATVTNILGFLNPFMLIGKAINVVGTLVEGSAQKADIASLLKSIKVGNGRMQDLLNLTTTNKDLGLTGNLAEVVTGISRYSAASKTRSALARLSGLDTNLSGDSGLRGLFRNADYDAQMFLAGASSIADKVTGGRKSVYSWNTLTKKDAAILSGKSRSVASASMSKQQSSEAAEEAAKKLLASKLITTTKTMGDKDSKGKLKYQSYDDWKKSAQTKVKDWEKALEAAGVSESQLQTSFESFQAQQGALEQQARLEREDDFWQAGKDFWRADEFRTKEFEFWEITKKYQINELTETKNIHTTLAEVTNNILTTISTDLKAFYTDWVNYFVNYSLYGDGSGSPNIHGRTTYDYSDIERIANEEKDESYDAINALSEALTKNIVDLHDPQVATNALLSRILQVAQAILQQEQSADTSGSPLGTLTSMSTGNL